MENAPIDTADQAWSREAGASVHSDAEQLGRTYSGAHLLHREADVTFRPRGGGHRKAGA